MLDALELINSTAIDVVIDYCVAGSEAHRLQFDDREKAMRALKRIAQKSVRTGRPCCGTVTSLKRTCSFACQWGQAFLVWDNPKSTSGQSSMSLL